MTHALWLVVMATVGLVLLLVGMVIHALWTDHEEQKAEREQLRRIELESCLRSSPPQVVSFRGKASKGFQR